MTRLAWEAATSSVEELPAGETAGLAVIATVGEVKTAPPQPARKRKSREQQTSISPRELMREMT